ncbi:MAG: thiol-disulfide oxidoreductase DCC family protein [Candidatus Nanohaloarchaea archaeon]
MEPGELPGKGRTVVLFDGLCDLCSGLVRFTIARDSEKKFRFAPLRSDTGKDILDDAGADTGELETFVLVEDGQVYTRSTAAVRLLKGLGGGWSIAAYLLEAVPRPLRDLCYRLVARIRYPLFGRRESCMVPSPEIKDRFLKQDL